MPRTAIQAIATNSESRWNSPARASSQFPPRVAATSPPASAVAATQAQTARDADRATGERPTIPTPDRHAATEAPMTVAPARPWTAPAKLRGTRPEPAG